MATIRKRNDKYNVVYDYYDSEGNRKQKSDSYKSFAEANKRKIEIEKEKSDNTFIPPSVQTVEEFLALFIELYGTKKWALSTYEKSNKTISNYIIPYIGKLKVQALTPLLIERYYADLKKIPSVANKSRKSDKTVSTGSIKSA